MLIILCSLLVPVLLLVPMTTVMAADSYAVHTGQSDFETVLEGAEAAILERGLYINDQMPMNTMLERTGKDLGMNEKLYLHAQSIEFCSAMLARKMTSEDPRRIVNCPFILTVYVLPGEPDKTHVAYRKIPAQEVASSAAMAEVAAMLRAVAEAAIAW